MMKLCSLTLRETRSDSGIALEDQSKDKVKMLTPTCASNALPM